MTNAESSNSSQGPNSDNDVVNRIQQILEELPEETASELVGLIIDVIPNPRLLRQVVENRLNLLRAEYDRFKELVGSLPS
jgi:hypothetical protein